MIAHEFATLFPMLSDEDLKSLADDISVNGLQIPITTLDGKILDGRNRGRACELAGVDPTYEEYQGGDPLGFVISHNLHRRHLTESQRGMVAAKMANLSKGGAGGYKTDPSIDGSPITQAKAQEILNVGESTVTRAKKVQRLGSPELINAVESGDITIGAAYKVASLPKEEQSAVVAKGSAAIRDAAKNIRETEKAPEPEPEPVIVDGVTEAPVKQTRTPKWVPDDADRLWLLAKQDLNKILPNDKSRERVLREIVAYAQGRIDSQK